ncbi:unnamed protein product [Allacma fusca]|uniref:Costars domain-containing protein n=1 Tax=Allacma fusca TaxID=39272 RepID=A0A8J2PRK5_9HEXA|nr:unnamed protein product [Allacma fusca]
MSSPNDLPGKDLVKIYGNSSLSDRINTFQQNSTKRTKGINDVPKSAGQFDILGLSKDDPRYGHPPEGSKTEMRGLKAGTHISKEIQELCSLIKEYGLTQPDNSTIIEFKELFNLYTVISNKVVGLLLRARKHGLVDFPGEMLFQRRDDHVIIKLFPQED